MINLMKADLYRLFKSKGFYIAIVIMFMMIGISVYLLEPGNIGMSVSMSAESEGMELLMSEVSDMTYEQINNLSPGDMREIMLKSDGYKLDKAILSVNINLYYIFIFIAVIILTSDFSSGGAKNTLSSSISRRKYFASKSGLIIICCTVLLFCNTYIMYFANLILNGKKFSSGLKAVTMITIKQIPPVIALACILAGLGFLVRKTAVFNTVSIPLVMVFQLLFTLCIRFLKLKRKYMDYELQVMIANLAKKTSDSYMAKSYLLCGALMLIFTIIGYLSFRRSEIK